MCFYYCQIMFFLVIMIDEVKDLVFVFLKNFVWIFVNSNIDVVFFLWQEFIWIWFNCEGDWEVIVVVLLMRIFIDYVMLFM